MKQQWKCCMPSRKPQVKIGSARLAKNPFPVRLTPVGNARRRGLRHDLMASRSVRSMKSRLLLLTAFALGLSWIHAAEDAKPAKKPDAFHITPGDAKVLNI